MEPKLRVLEDTKLARLFMSKTRCAIIKALAKEPRSISQLARTFGISPPAVHYHIKMLEEAKMIEVVRVEKVRNNLVEKFYGVTSPLFLIFGDGPSRKSPVPPKDHPAETGWVLNFDGLEEVLSQLDLSIQDDHDRDIENEILRLLTIISSYAKDLSRQALAQLDHDMTNNERQKIESLVASLVPLSLIMAFDDARFMDGLRSIKRMLCVR